MRFHGFHGFPALTYTWLYTCTIYRYTFTLSRRGLQAILRAKSGFQIENINFYLSYTDYHIVLEIHNLLQMRSAGSFGYLLRKKVLE